MVDKLCHVDLILNTPRSDELEEFEFIKTNIIRRHKELHDIERKDGNVTMQTETDPFTFNSNLLSEFRENKRLSVVWWFRGRGQMLRDVDSLSINATGKKVI
jgi:hypothetical protein